LAAGTGFEDIIFEIRAMLHNIRQHRGRVFCCGFNGKARDGIISSDPFDMAIRLFVMVNMFGGNVLPF